MTPEEVEHALNTDLFFFAEEAPLKIKGKGPGEVLVWQPNIGQRFLIDEAERMLREIGFVRILIPKARQVGISTCIELRGYHKTRSNRAYQMTVISHDTKATAHLFGMLEFAHDNVSEELRPRVGKSNVNELELVDLDSKVSVFTAGSENASRGGTSQFFHGSEVAYWKNPDAIQDGALQAIGLVPGTEVFLESTGNGPFGLYYDKVQLALQGKGFYRVVFVPWFWMDDYEVKDDGSPLTEEELVFCRLHFAKPFPYETQPPTRARQRRKMLWRRLQIEEFGAHAGGYSEEVGRFKFMTKYPSTVAEVFQTTSAGQFHADAILAARKAFHITDESAPLIAGVDPAGDSEKSDRTVITLRRGRVIEDVLVWKKMRPMELAGICAKLIDDRGIDMMFIDRGHGEGTIDRLWELGYKRKVVGIAFNETPTEEDRFLNKRSEMIIAYSEWINSKEVRIPDRDDIQADLAAIPLEKTTPNGLKFIASSEEIKKLLRRSCDIVASGALTFAYIVRREGPPGTQRFRTKTDEGTGVKVKSPLRSRRLIRGRD